jgi:archaellum biogenesis protein FlaJ (TadC family)
MALIRIGVVAFKSLMWMLIFIVFVGWIIGIAMFFVNMLVDWKLLKYLEQKRQ